MTSDIITWAVGSTLFPLLLQLPIILKSDKKKVAIAKLVVINIVVSVLLVLAVSASIVFEFNTVIVFTGINIVVVALLGSLLIRLVTKKYTPLYLLYPALIIANQVVRILIVGN